MLCRSRGANVTAVVINNAVLSFLSLLAHIPVFSRSAGCCSFLASMGQSWSDLVSCQPCRPVLGEALTWTILSGFRMLMLGAMMTTKQGTATLSSLAVCQALSSKEPGTFRFLEEPGMQLGGISMSTTTFKSTSIKSTSRQT